MSYCKSVISFIFNCKCKNDKLLTVKIVISQSNYNSAKSGIIFMPVCLSICLFLVSRVIQIPLVGFY